MPLRREALPRHDAGAQALTTAAVNPTALPWPTDALAAALGARRPGLRVEVWAEADSSNTRLLDRARGGDAAPCLLVVEHQTAGRGRLGRPWFADAPAADGPPGPATLCLSLGLVLAPTDWSGLSLAVGVALADALDPDPPPGAPRIGLKWPNDLWLMDDFSAGHRSGRKLGGVLIETVAAGSRRLAVIGIGLNVLPMGGVADPGVGHASLQEIDPSLDPPAALARVALPLARALKAFDADGFAPFAPRFAARDLLAGQPVRTTHSEAAEGIAVGVTDFGALEVDTGSGLLEVTSGEVSVRLGRG
jgi:BirA family biotin operon repressor/biotin-[acetyl-CoA-carboxylase] ligase